ncbi:DEAD/DEAH box helicase [uncultured Fibrella sp.]|uniref:DEAD/DEAH box helicase n=1 Tax=uncultured Fibrella sp. TaxID=1284596 RepID=UPI0035CB5305
MTESRTHVLASLGIEALNPMQAAAEQAILPGTDTFLMAPTGSGKTLGFLLPVLQLLQPDTGKVQCLVLVPSRELAMQIEQVWRKMATGFKVNVCYGGHSVETEVKNLSNPPALLIGTPGRIADHLTRRTFATDGIETLVLDEFDKSLTLGFHDEMAYIIDNLPNLQTRVLVSATSGVAIPDFIELHNPTWLTFEADEDKPAALTLKAVYTNGPDDRATLFRLLCTLGSESALIFCNLRDTVEQLSDWLNSKGLYSTAYHGALEQADRERALIRFRGGSVTYLITTDLAARGLDIPDMKHVIHYELPDRETEFTHRNGRTARMHASGTAYVMLPKDVPGESTPNPFYLRETLDEFTLPTTTPALPEPPAYVTVYISGGKKNKINKVDIVGFFAQKGQLAKDDLGRLEVGDFMSFASVRRSKVADLLSRIQNEKMKGKKYKIEIAR